MNPLNESEARLVTPRELVAHLDDPRWIVTAALAMLGGAVRTNECRRPEIAADAAYWILTRSGEASGHFFLDEEALRAAGVDDFRRYNVDPESERLLPDIFLDPPATEST